MDYFPCKNLIYKKATLADIDILTKTRIDVLRAANQLSADTDMEELKKQSRHYYQKALCDNTHIAYLIFDNERFAGAGGVSFFQVMPTFHNPSGQKAYIMNMYTAPEYRRAISLEATAMGRPLYEKYGFVKMNDEMELPL